MPRSIALGIDMLAVRTATLPPATHTNCYALGTDDVVIVEPAAENDSEAAAFVSWVRSMNARVLAIVVTHHHVDHAGGAMRLSTELKVPLWAHAATAERVKGAVFDRLLKDGDEIVLGGRVEQRWRVLHTPGHAPGHVCLHEPNAGALVLGDMVASQGTILIAPGEGDMIAYLSQLERLEALEARLGLPSHGEPMEKPSELLRKTRAHRLMREEKVVAAFAGCGEGGATADDLLELAYADTPLMVWPIARLSLLSHLEKLEREGRVRRRGDRWFSR